MDIVEAVMPSIYMSKLSSESLVRYVRFGHLLKRTLYFSPLLESQSEVRVEGKELYILHLDSEVSYGTRASVVVLLIEETDLYISTLTESTAFHVASFSSLGE